MQLLNMLMELLELWQWSIIPTQLTSLILCQLGLSMRLVPQLLKLLQRPNMSI